MTNDHTPQALVPVVAPAWVYSTAVPVLKHVAGQQTVPTGSRERILAAAQTLETQATKREGVGDLLFDAYVAGFMQSGEGFNGELHAGREEQAREAIREDFEDWVGDTWDQEGFGDD